MNDAPLPHSLDRTIVIRARRETVFRYFTDSLRWAKWWGAGSMIDPEFTTGRPGDVRESLADITLARSLLNYKPTIDFDEGLRRSIDYYKTLC